MGRVNKTVIYYLRIIFDIIKIVNIAQLILTLQVSLSWEMCDNKEYL